MYLQEDGDDVGSRMVADGLLRTERRRDRKAARLVSRREGRGGEGGTHTHTVF